MNQPDMSSTDMEMVLGGQEVATPVAAVSPARNPYRIDLPSASEMREIFREEGVDRLPRFWQVAGLTPVGEQKLKSLADWVRNGSKHSQVKVAEFKGPSGTGKTFAVEALAGESADVAQYWELDAGQILSSYHAEGSQNMTAAFAKLLRERQEALANGERPNLIVAIHEGETIGGDRDAGDKEYANVVNALINGVDLLRKSNNGKDGGRVLFVFTTNKELDTAIQRRAGAEVVDFKLPSDEGRAVALVSAVNMKLKEQEEKGHEPYFTPELEATVKSLRSADPEERKTVLRNMAREWRQFILMSSGASQGDIAVAVQAALESAEGEGKLVGVEDVQKVLETMMPHIQARNVSEGALRRVN